MDADARRDWPRWVFAFFWLSILLALAGVAGGLWLPPLFVAALFVFAAWWYWLAIKWVDQNASW